jgi:aminodeoxyfutalosine deaminase
MPPPEFTLQARYIFPVGAPPIESGTIRIAGERIVSVGTAQSSVDIDLGNAAIVPGFVNAHTHLELSTLRARELGGGDFAAWLKRVIAARATQSPAEVAHAVSRGIDASLSAGTTLIADISTSGRSWKELLRSPLRGVVFAELIGLKSDRAVQTALAARQFLEWANQQQEKEKEPANVAADEPFAALALPDGTPVELEAWPAQARSGRRLSPSLSPHAPYSTHPILYELAAAWGHRSHAPICTHLAETDQELRLLRDRAGPLREFLLSIGAWSEDWEPVGTDPSSYVIGRGSTHWLLAHGNYLTEEAIAALAGQASRTGSRCAIAYCPRTHNYFGHRSHPYGRMLSAGLIVCLGTDSLASTPSLSILDEMRFVHRRDRSLDGATLLGMGTIEGARALGCEQECGSLTPGKLADLAVIRLPSTNPSDPYELIFDSDEPVVRTMVGGRLVFQLR